MAAPSVAQTGGLMNTTATTTHTLASQSVSAVTDGIGVFVIWDNSGANSADLVTGMTWGGNAMTRVTSQTSPTGAPFPSRYYMYYIVNPPTGTVSMVATTSINRNLTGHWAVIQDAAQQAPEAFNSLQKTNSNTFQPTVTTITNDSLVIGGCFAAYPSSAPTADTGTTIHYNNSNIWLLWSDVQATAGSNTSGFSSIGVATTDTNGIVAAFAPVGGGGGIIKPNYLGFSRL